MFNVVQQFLSKRVLNVHPIFHIISMPFVKVNVALLIESYGSEFGGHSSLPLNWLQLVAIRSWANFAMWEGAPFCWEMKPDGRRDVCILQLISVKQFNVTFKSKSKSIYLDKSLDTQVPKDTDASPTKENNRTMRHTGLCELHPHKGG